MDAATRSLVWERARQRYEYCRIHQDDSDFLTFHVEHVIARQHGGTDDADNLCLACSECNWAKGPNLVGLIGGKLYPLFHPRRQRWRRHFLWDGPIVVGRTLCGRATAQVLNLNDPARVMLRENLIAEGQFPPEED
jgi:hypothetical protein